MGESVLLIVSPATVVLSLILLVGVFFQRFRNIAFQRKLKRGIELIKPLMHSYAVDGSQRLELTKQIRRHRQAGLHLLLRYLPYLTGTSRKHLASLAQQEGYVRDAMNATFSSSWKRRETAAMHLGLFRLIESVPDLIRLLLDRRSEVRYTAARSLAMIGSKEAFDGLLSLLDRPELFSTARLLEIVQRIARPEVAPLTEYLKNQDVPVSTRLLLIDLVRDWNDYRLLPVLHELLDEENEEIVIRTVKALAQIGHEDSIPMLVNLVDHPSWEIRAQVQKAIRRFGFIEALPVIRQALHDDAYWVRRNAAETLAELGPEAQVYLDPQLHFDDQFAQDIGRYQQQRLGLFVGVASISSRPAEQPATAEG